GALREALGWVTDTAPRGSAHAMTALFLRRLVRLTSDHEQRALILGEMLEADPTADDRPELELGRAEALEQAGRRAEAAAAYREQLAGPLAVDADIGLRRVLWALRDGEALEALLRDEHDALNGAGRTPAAARALVEKARAALDLREDPETAREDLRRALELEPEQR